jgi:TPR repeat protein
MILEGKGISTPNFVEAFTLLKKAAARHVPQAQHSVAIMYEYGLGMAVDYQKAIEYYERAAEQNFMESMYNLGLMYAYGRGTRQDFARAMALFDHAAMHDHAPSAYYMGVMKMNGHGTPIDYEEAKAWFEKAHSLDDYRITDRALKASQVLEELLAEADDVNTAIFDQYRARDSAGLDDL